jgi:hypothetical protein
MPHSCPATAHQRGLGRRSAAAGSSATGWRWVLQGSRGTLPRQATPAVPDVYGVSE